MLLDRYIGVSPVGGALDSLILDHLDPVSIGVQDERDVLHHAIGKTLLERYLKGLEAVAGALQIVGGDA
jgi:hypothetical protein